MTTKFNVGDTVLIKGIVVSIYVETASNEPVYFVRLKGARTHQVYSITVKEGVMKNDGILSPDCDVKKYLEKEKDNDE